MDEELERLRGFPEIGRDELVRFFTLTSSDLVFVDPGRGRGPGERLGLAVALCTLPWLGFVPDVVTAPAYQPRPATPSAPLRTDTPRHHRWSHIFARSVSAGALSGSLTASAATSASGTPGPPVRPSPTRSEVFAVLPWFLRPPAQRGPWHQTDIHDCRQTNTAGRYSSLGPLLRRRFRIV